MRAQVRATDGSGSGIGIGGGGGGGGEGLRVRRVAEGETLFRIAREEGISVAFLLEANPGLEPSRLRPGQRVVVPRIVVGPRIIDDRGRVDVRAPSPSSASASASSSAPLSFFSAPLPFLSAPGWSAGVLPIAAEGATAAIAIAVAVAAMAVAPSAVATGEAQASRVAQGLDAASSAASAALRWLGAREPLAHAAAARATGFALGATGATLVLHTPRVLGALLADPRLAGDAAFNLAAKALGLSLFSLCPLLYQAATLGRPADRARFRTAVVQSVGLGAALWAWTAGWVRAQAVASASPVLAVPEWLHSATSALLVAQACLWALAYLAMPLAALPDALDRALPRSRALRWATCIFAAAAAAALADAFLTSPDAMRLAADAAEASQRALNAGVLHLERALRPAQAPAERALAAGLAAGEQAIHLSLVVPAGSAARWAGSAASAGSATLTVTLGRAATDVQAAVVASLGAAGAAVTRGLGWAVGGPLDALGADAEALLRGLERSGPWRALSLLAAEAATDIVRLLDAWDPGLLANYRASRITLPEALRASPLGRWGRAAGHALAARAAAAGDAANAALRDALAWTDPVALGVLATLVAAAAYAIHCLSFSLPLALALAKMEKGRRRRRRGSSRGTVWRHDDIDDDDDDDDQCLV